MIVLNPSIQDTFNIWANLWLQQVWLQDPLIFKSWCLGHSLYKYICDEVTRLQALEFIVVTIGIRINCC